MKLLAEMTKSTFTRGMLNEDPKNAWTNRMRKLGANEFKGEGPKTNTPTKLTLALKDGKLVGTFNNITGKEIALKEAKGDTVEAHGIRGMKRTPWQRTFKDVDALNKWVDANDSVEVLGTRDTDAAKKGNLSPAVPGYTDWFNAQQKKKDARAAGRKNSKDAQASKIELNSKIKEAVEFKVGDKVVKTFDDGTKVKGKLTKERTTAKGTKVFYLEPTGKNFGSKYVGWFNPADMVAEGASGYYGVHKTTVHGKTSCHSTHDDLKSAEQTKKDLEKKFGVYGDTYKVVHMGFSDADRAKKYLKTAEAVDDLDPAISPRTQAKREQKIDKHSFLGKIKRHHELKGKVDATWDDAVQAEKKGDKKGADKAFNKHVRYTNLERPGTWTNVKDKDVKEEKINEFAPSNNFKPPKTPASKGNGPWEDDNRSQIGQAVKKLLASGNKVDWRVPGQIGHVVSVDDSYVTLKKWNQPYSKMRFALPIDADRDNKYQIVPKGEKYYTVISSDVKEEFNDDDLYLVDNKTKKVVSNLGNKKVDAAHKNDPSNDPALKQYIEDPKSQSIMRGMIAKRTIKESKFTAVDSGTFDGDEIGVLVTSKSLGKHYYGINVIFKNGKFKEFVTGDDQSEQESKKFKDEVIAVAKEFLK